MRPREPRSVILGQTNVSRHPVKQGPGGSLGREGLRNGGRYRRRSTKSGSFERLNPNLTPRNEGPDPSLVQFARRFCTKPRAKRSIFSGSGGCKIPCDFVTRSHALRPAPRRTAKTPQNPAVEPLMSRSDERFAAVKQRFPKIGLRTGEKAVR